MFIVKDAINTRIKACNSDTNLEIIAQLMWDFDCESIPIADHDNKPKGIISDRDITMTAMFKHLPLWKIKAKDIVNNRLFYYCKNDDPLDRWLKIMKDMKLKSLPVVDRDNAYIGMLPLSNVIALTSNKQIKLTKPNHYHHAKRFRKIKDIFKHAKNRTFISDS